MAFDWTAIFDNFGRKRVTQTDKNKSAYVLNEAQREAVSAAGVTPSEGGTKKTIKVEILFDPEISSVRASYYNSLRAGSGRTPETRMGQGLIRWVDVGDEIIIGNKGNRIIAARVGALPDKASDLGRTLARNGDRKKILKKARQAAGKPARKTRTVQDFVRNPYVVAAALLRSAGACEMPDCTRRLFRRDDGSNFLEVHHITPLGEGGDDTLVNAAALCPSCHRELHFGARRMKKRAILSAHIAAQPDS
jgi:hypothetical protein